MTRADRIEAEFPPGMVMPPRLRELCDHLDSHGYPISGYMKLRPEGQSLQAWFGPGTQAWNALAGFGAGPDGSILAFWLYEGGDISRAPVVHLGSEGSAFVLADGLDEFLRLFGVGYSELGFDDLSLSPEEPESAERLRHWLQDRFGIVAPSTGADIVARAQACHPGFAVWVREAQRIRDEV